MKQTGERALDWLVAVVLAFASFAALYFWFEVAVGVAAAVGAAVLVVGLVVGRNLIHFVPH